MLRAIRPPRLDRETPRLKQCAPAALERAVPSKSTTLYALPARHRPGTVPPVSTNTGRVRLREVLPGFPASPSDDARLNIAMSRQPGVSPPRTRAARESREQGPGRCYQTGQSTTGAPVMAGLPCAPSARICSASRRRSKSSVRHRRSK